MGRGRDEAKPLGQSWLHLRRYPDLTVGGERKCDPGERLSRPVGDMLTRDKYHYYLEVSYGLIFGSN